MADHTAYLADVFADAERVNVTDVKVGDSLFDVYGGRHAVTKVVVSAQFTRIHRDDQSRPDVFTNSETITIVRKPQEG